MTGRDLTKDFLEKINKFHQDCALNFIDDVEFDPNTLGWDKHLFRHLKKNYV